MGQLVDDLLDAPAAEAIAEDGSLILERGLPSAQDVMSQTSTWGLKEEEVSLLRLCSPTASKVFEAIRQMISCLSSSS